MSPRKRSLLGEAAALRPAGGGGSAFAVLYRGKLRSPLPTANEAAYGGAPGPSAERR